VYITIEKHLHGGSNTGNPEWMFTADRIYSEGARVCNAGEKSGVR